MKSRISVLALVFFSALTVHAGDKIGNGGGAWVCRESNGDIRWAELVDLFEAENEFGLSIASRTGRYEDIVSQVKKRLADSNAVLSGALTRFLDRVGNLESNPPQITYTTDDLQVIDDALFRLKPSTRRCVAGTLAYEQVVNYKNDGMILLQRDLFSAMSDAARAAMVLHEAIYAYRRDQSGDTNSVVTRRIVGLIFSTLTKEELTKALSDLGESDIAWGGMRFVKVSAGTFMMGSGSESHQVTLTHEYEMQTTPVTQGQWFQVMATNPTTTVSQKYCPDSFVAAKANLGIALCPNHPVANVSWNDVQSFLFKLNKSHGDGYFYRLPTEAEWEHAAFAGETDFLKSGMDESEMGDFGWYAVNSGGHTHEVAGLKPNELGLYDMVGNVWQWVSDFYADYPKSPTVDPSGEGISGNHVVRGGSFQNGSWIFRAYSRFPYSSVYRSDELGFRLVRAQ